MESIYVTYKLLHDVYAVKDMPLFLPLQCVLIHYMEYDRMGTKQIIQSNGNRGSNNFIRLKFRHRAIFSRFSTKISY